MSSTLSDLETHAIEEHPEGDSLATKVAGRSPTQLALARFRKDKLSMAAFTVVALVFIAGIMAPFLVMSGFLDPTSFHNTSRTGQLIDPSTGLATGKWGGISGDHWLGVEPGTGRDVLSRMWYGITFSLAIAISGALFTVTVGTAVGIVAGASGGFVDAAIGRCIDLVLSFPVTLMLLALSSPGVVFLDETLHVPSGPNKSFVNGLYVVLVLGVFGWPYVARLVRGQVLSLREREFVEAAKLIGASKFRLYFKEILPNLWAPVLVIFTITMPTYVSAEAALNFLGVGIKPPTPTLGNLLTASDDYATSAFLFFLFPAFLIMVIVVSFNLLGDGIRDALDPKGNR
ncbi:ABC transporter permease [Nocardioides speluncae]|uniref:ABC transporter permease n=1 Tax=Nocardioides speluncae TaxID=2670337 RepID=UPI000D693C07|nr:ABC transporter permease [Nocardioides speluncae]